MDNERNITEEYKEFINVATELADKDMEHYVLPSYASDKKWLKEHGKNIDDINADWYNSRINRHLTRMMHLYDIRYGDADERLKIITYLERNLLPCDKVSNDTWLEIRKQILSGEYQDLT
jgi:hypothetical protein